MAQSPVWLASRSKQQTRASSASARVRTFQLIAQPRRGKDKLYVGPPASEDPPSSSSALLSSAACLAWFPRPCLRLPGVFSRRASSVDLSRATWVRSAPRLWRPGPIAIARTRLLGCEDAQLSTLEQVPIGLRSDRLLPLLLLQVAPTLDAGR